MQSEFDSDAYDSDEFDREGNRLHYEEDSDSDRLVIDEDSEYYDQRRQKNPPKAREDRGNQQYMEGNDNDGLVLDYSSSTYISRSWLFMYLMIAKPSSIYRPIWFEM